MSHLSTDRLAAIVDDTPTAEEATHLAGCWDCRAEVAAYRRLARMSAMAPVPMEPLTAWSRLAPQLRAEGIIVDASYDKYNVTIAGVSRKFPACETLPPAGATPDPIYGRANEWPCVPSTEAVFTADKRVAVHPALKDFHLAAQPGPAVRHVLRQE